MSTQPRAKATVYGPYDITSKIGMEGIPFLTLPFKSVSNSQLLLNIEDNAVASLAAGNQPNNNVAYLMVLAELAVWGSVQGYSYPIKRMTIRSGWGPMTISLGDEDAFDQVVFKGRLFVGGKPGIPSDISFSTPLKVTATIHVQPREGLGY